MYSELHAGILETDRFLWMRHLLTGCSSSGLSVLLCELVGLSWRDHVGVGGPETIPESSDSRAAPFFSRVLRREP